MVVTGIFMILSGVVLSTNARFGDTIKLQNLAQDIALSVRQAQVYGIAVRRYSGENFDVSYGIIFQLSAPNTYQIFADVNRDGKYDAAGDAIINSTTIMGGYRITALCTKSGLSEDCATPQRVDIVFRRPEPDACLGTAGSVTYNAAFKCVSSLDKVKIRVESNRGDQVDVVVEASGQISVQ